MRPKIVISILLPLIALLALVLLRPDKAPAPDAVVSPAPPAVSTPPEKVIPAEEPLVRKPPAVSNAAVADSVSNAAPVPAKIAPADHELMVEQRANELNELARQNNSEAHQKILVELKNPDREIRLAAIEALKLANDVSVLPQMQQIADETDDLDEKVALRDAIEFIQLPTLTEYFKKGRNAGAEK